MKTVLRCDGRQNNTDCFYRIDTRSIYFLQVIADGSGVIILRNKYIGKFLLRNGKTANDVNAIKLAEFDAVRGAAVLVARQLFR